MVEPGPELIDSLTPEPKLCEPLFLPPQIHLECKVTILILLPSSVPMFLCLPQATRRLISPGPQNEIFIHDRLNKILLKS